MANIALIIVGPPGTGKSCTGNIILGKKVFSTDKNPEQASKKMFEMESTDDKKIVVFDTSGKINKTMFKDIMKNAEVVAEKVVVLLTAKAALPEASGTYLDTITEPKSILKKSYLIIWTKDKLSSKEKESEKLKELMTKFPNGYMYITFDLKEEELKKQREKLIVMVNADDEAAASSDEVPVDTDSIAAGKTSEEHCMDKAPLYIAIVGSPGSGKSSTGNVLLGENVFETDLYNDKEVLNDCKVVKIKDKKKEIYIIDTPGEMDPASVKKYLDTLVKKKAAMYALLVTMNVSTRMSPAEQARISQMKSAFGDSYIKDHLHVSFTHGDQFNILAENISIIIIGPKRSGKTTIGNHILGHDSSGYRPQSYNYQSFHVTPGSFQGTDVVVIDSSGELTRKLFQQMLTTGSILASSVIVVLVVKATDLGKRFLELFENVTAAGLKNQACLIVTDISRYHTGPIEQFRTYCGLGTIEIKTQHDASSKMSELHSRFFCRSEIHHARNRSMTQQKKEEKRNMLYVIVMGAPGSGKSSTANAILGEQKFETALYKEAHTRKIQKERVGNSTTTRMESFVVDTPSEMNITTIQQVKDLLDSHSPSHHVLLITITIGTRMSPEEQRRIDTLEKEFGAEFLRRHAAIVFTHGDEFSVILRQGSFRSFEEWLQHQRHGILPHFRQLCGDRSILVNNMVTSQNMERQNTANIWKLIEEIQYNI